MDVVIQTDLVAWLAYIIIISAISGDDRETSYLFQRISVLILRFNATLLHESFADENRSDD